MENWISLKQELPDLGVFVEGKGSDFMGEYRVEGIARKERKLANKHGHKKWRWICKDGTNLYSFGEIEFWRPLTESK